MKKVLLLCCLNLLIHLAFCQNPPGFNLRLTSEFSNTKLYQLLIDNDTIIGLGTSEDSLTGFVSGITLMKFDTLGNLLTAKLLQDTLIGPNPLFIRWGSLLKTPDGGYIMNVIPFLFAYPVILKTDKDFNIEFIKYFEEPETFDYFQCELKSLNDGYILHGVLFRPNGLGDGFVRKLDLTGETVWMKVFGAYNKNESIVDVKVKNDSTYVVSMVKEATSPTSSFSSIVIIDQYGNELQTWNSEPEPEIGYIRGVLSANDGGYFVYGLHVEEILPSPPFDTKLVLATFSKLDEDFNLEWIKKYGKKADLSSEVMFYNFVETIDEEYIGVGKTSLPQGDTTSISTGWLMKFSKEGDSIWSRLDLSDLSPHTDSDRHALGGVGVLSSGSIIAGGYAERWPDSYIWLIKTTNDGCIDTLYCGLVSGTQSEPPKAQQPVSIYPNPASNLLHLTITDMAALPYSLSVVDMSGRVCSANNEVAEGQSTMDVSTLPAGLYLLCFKFANGEVHFEKVNILR